MRVLRVKEDALKIADAFENNRKLEMEQRTTNKGGETSQQIGKFISKTFLDLFLEKERNGNGDEEHVKVPWWYQTYVLWIRFLRTWMRNPILFWSEFAQYVFNGFLIGYCFLKIAKHPSLGLMYFQVNNDLNFGVVDRYASQFFVMAALIFVPAFAAVTLWDTERKLLKVETNRKAYSIFSYFLAKTATTWPMEIFLTMLMSLVVYWMIGKDLRTIQRHCS